MAALGAKRADAYWELHQVTTARYCENVERVARDCIRNPYVLESNAHTIRQVMGEAAMDEILRLRGI